MDETVRRDYGASLAELKINSKPLINMLTMLAEDHIANAPEIVRLIETRLQKEASRQRSFMSVTDVNVSTSNTDADLS